MSEIKALPPGEPQKSEATAPPLEFGDVGISLRSAEDAWRFAKRCFDSGMLPDQINNANQAFVILCKGAELGLPPFASWSYVYLTKARRLALTTKGALAVVQSKPAFDGYREWTEGEGVETKACAMAKRKGFPPMVKEFTYRDAEAAGLLKRKRSREGNEYDGPWQAFVKDMMLARARGRVLDLVFAAELGGIPVEGVAEDTDMMEARAAAVTQPAHRVGVGELRALPPASEDPLLSLLQESPAAKAPTVSGPFDGFPKIAPQREAVPVVAGGPPPTEDVMDPALVKVIEEQVEEMWPRDSGAPPAAQPEAVKPAASADPPAGAETGGGRPPLGKLAASMGLPSPCPRCNVKLNALGGCDNCGYPGEDMR